jgi:hypothetical protein
MKLKKNVINSIIIGAGQLGSRHLQGLLKINKPQKIYIIDPSRSSLDTAYERTIEIKHTHQLIFSESMEILPKKAFLAIIATNANIRKSVTFDLLQRCSLDHIILEKVLFQDIESYNDFLQVTNKYATKHWVNHPRRMFPHYQHIRTKFIDKNQINFNAFGSNWGLACNALHFIDIFCFMSNSKLRSIDCNGLKQEIIESKRSGFIEFTGTITGKLENGNTFSIECTENDPSPITVTAFEASDRYIIQEGGTPQFIQLNKENSYHSKISIFDLQFQSSLTTDFAKALLNDGSCVLPTYEEAANSHILFIQAFLKFYNNLTKENNTTLPIT